jgi:hypothetical protein
MWEKSHRHGIRAAHNLSRRRHEVAGGGEVNTNTADALEYALSKTTKI